MTEALDLLTSQYGPIPNDMHLEVHLTRSSPRKLDYDNFVYALKWVRDAISDFVWPDKKLAVRDDHDLVSWKYDQITGPQKLIIEIIGIDK